MVGGVLTAVTEDELTQWRGEERCGIYCVVIKWGSHLVLMSVLMRASKPFTLLGPVYENLYAIIMKQADSGTYVIMQILNSEYLERADPFIIYTCTCRVSFTLRYPAYVLSHIPNLPTLEPERSLKAGLLLYTSWLIQLYTHNHRAFEKKGVSSFTSVSGHSLS